VKCFYCGTSVRRTMVEPSATRLTPPSTSAPSATASAERIRTHSGAIWALVLGIMSPVAFVLFGATLHMRQDYIGGRPVGPRPFVLTALTVAVSVPALVVGFRSLRAIAEGHGGLRGRGLAIAGIVVSALNSALWATVTWIDTFTAGR